MTRSGIVFDRLVLRHESQYEHGHAHPESPARLEPLLAKVESKSLAAIGVEVENERAAFDPTWVTAVHDPKYWNQIVGSEGQSIQLDPDTSTNAWTVDALRRNSQMVVAAVDALLSDTWRRGFALTRPPGHHARPEQAMGFCFVNQVALAIARARKRWGISKVSVIDWDVHHGNGTQDIFVKDPNVTIVDLHQAHHYPNTGRPSQTGAAAGVDHIVNWSLPGGCSYAEYESILDITLPRVWQAQRPELVIVAAGFDAHQLDPLGAMQLSSADYLKLAQRIYGHLARLDIEAPVLFVLEGGYVAQALCDSVWGILESFSAPNSTTPFALDDADHRLDACTHLRPVANELRRVHGLFRNV